MITSRTDVCKLIFVNMKFQQKVLSKVERNILHFKMLQLLGP